MKPPRILLLTRRPNALAAIIHWLKKERMEVASAQPGKGRGEASGAGKVDCILLDLAPPAAAALRLCRRLTSSPKTREIPIVLLASRVQPRERMRGLEAGARDFLSTPLERTETVLRVRHALNARTLQERWRKRVAVFRCLSSSDALTGLCNRRGAERILAREVKRAIRGGTPLCFAAGDLDHFKEINDGYGHKAGDGVLKEAGSLFSRNIRRSDCLARPSGDEFWLIAPGTGRDGGFILCEKLRILVSGLKLTRLKPPPAISISWGLTELDPSREANAGRLIEEADHALYRSKHRGRNRTSVFRGLV
ncbi:MAG: diguanylate cyclase [Candidatus Aureabacteria bacterium]|nr:diguanylate cyclase [Candidatus Auribacterota bacterium]